MNYFLKSSLTVLTILAASTGNAKPLLNGRCIGMIESTVNHLAAKLSGDRTATIDSNGLNERVTKFNRSIDGSEIYRIDTGKIFIGEGYLQGDGASVLVKMTASSCRIVGLDLKILDFQ